MPCGDSNQKAESRRTEWRSFKHRQSCFDGRAVSCPDGKGIPGEHHRGTKTSSVPLTKAAGQLGPHGEQRYCVLTERELSALEKKVEVVPSPGKETM